MRPGIIERAMEMAATGQCKSIEAIIKELDKEGYSGAYAHLQGKQIRERLNALCRDAKRATALDPQAAET